MLNENGDDIPSCLVPIHNVHQCLYFVFDIFFLFQLMLIVFCRQIY